MLRIRGQYSAAAEIVCGDCRTPLSTWSEFVAALHGSVDEERARLPEAQARSATLHLLKDFKPARARARLRAGQTGSAVLHPFLSAERQRETRAQIEAEFP
jgi:hypothetical protein